MASAATRIHSSTSISEQPVQLAEQHGLLMAAPLGYRVRRLLRVAHLRRRRCCGTAARRVQREGRARSAAADEGHLQCRRVAHLPDGPLDGRHRHVGAGRKVSADVGGAGRLRRHRIAGARGTDEIHPAIHRAWRRRSDGQRLGIAQHERGVEESGRERHLYRSPRRRPFRRRCPESSAALRVHGATEERVAVGKTTKQ